MTDDNNNKYIIYSILSAITFAVLIILLILICIKQKNTLNKFFLIMLCISEIFNCIPKFIQLLRINNHDNNILCYSQVVFSLISDIATLTTTTLMSVKAYDDSLNNYNWFKQKKKKKIVIIINIVFPLLFFFYFL